jgi:hypothetical protein
MADDASPETFALRTIHPSWSGVWIVALEQPLRDGLAKLQALLDGATTAIIAVCTQFDYDGVYEKIETIVPIPAGKNAAATAEAMLRTYLDEYSARHPDLRLDSEPVLPMNILPATHSIIPGTFPPQYGGFKLANEALYESIYVRLHIIEQPADAKSLFDVILAYEGIEESLIDCVARLGEFAR